MEGKNSTLEFIKKVSTVVVDSGDLNVISSLQAEDATTNPTLIFQSIDKEDTQPVLKKTLKYGQVIQQILNDASNVNASQSEIEELKSQIEYSKTYLGDANNESIILELTIDYFMVLMGCEILKMIPGKVSTEVPPQYSFDKHASIQKAKSLIKMYENQGVSSDRILIKLASTWEGIKAAEELEKLGIHCNMTLLFSLVQAKAAAEANATLISPFVGRILDWYKKNDPSKDYSGKNDPGVQSVTNIYNYYKQSGYKTIVMAASFRNLNEILELVGCDKLTIAPKFLQELEQMTSVPDLKLTPVSVDQTISVLQNNNFLDENSFRWQLNMDTMATEKLSEGIRNFYKDYLSLSSVLKTKLLLN